MGWTVVVSAVTHVFIVRVDETLDHRCARPTHPSVVPPKPKGSAGQGHAFMAKLRDEAWNIPNPSTHMHTHTPTPTERDSLLGQSDF